MVDRAVERVLDEVHFEIDEGVLRVEGSASDVRQALAAALGAVPPSTMDRLVSAILELRLQ